MILDDRFYLESLFQISILTLFPQMPVEIRIFADKQNTTYLVDWTGLEQDNHTKCANVLVLM